MWELSTWLDNSSASLMDESAVMDLTDDSFVNFWILDSGKWKKLQQLISFPMPHWFSFIILCIKAKNTWLCKWKTVFIIFPIYALIPRSLKLHAYIYVFFLIAAIYVNAYFPKSSNLSIRFLIDSIYVYRYKNFFQCRV